MAAYKRATPWVLAVAVVAAGCGGGSSGSSSEKAPATPAKLRVSSPAFINGAHLKTKYTCDGAGEEPPVEAGTVPASTRELVLIVSDPDAPSGTFIHVTRYGIDPRPTGSVSEGGREGQNSAGTTGWTPPCPPKGDTHHYVWSVYARRDPSNLPAGAKPDEVAAAVRDGVLASGSITAQYSRR